MRVLGSAVRRDKLGRRIGRNLWRDHVWEHWHAADHAWWLAMEAETSLYDAEVAEYRTSHPRPNLGDFMVALSPSWMPALAPDEHAGAA